MKISIVIPCYNEFKTILLVVEKIKSVFNNYDYEIIIIDDNSNDGTKELLLNKFTNSGDIVIKFNKKNYGKGFSLNRGFSLVSGDIICIQDADLEYRPDDLIPMIELIKTNHADVVFGSRFRGNGPVRANLFWNRMANFFITFLTNIVTNLSLTDIECCYKVFKKEHINQIEIKENRFGIEPELTIKLARLNLRIFEKGISYYGRTKSEGKKIGIIDGIRAIYCIFRYGLFK